MNSSVISGSLQPHRLYPASLLCPWNSPDKNTGVGRHCLLQRIFLIQGSNPCFLHCRHILYCLSHQGSSSFLFVVVESLSRVWLFATSWTAAHQASLSIINSWSLLKLMYTELVMPSKHLILCHPLLLPPSIFPSIRVFSKESILCIMWPKYRSCSLSMSFQWIFRIDFL